MRKFPDLGAGSGDLVAANEVEALPRRVQAEELSTDSSADSPSGAIADPDTGEGA